MHNDLNPIISNTMKKGSSDSYIFPEKLNFAEEPANVGRLSALAYFKIRQYRYARKLGMTGASFLISQLTKGKRKQMFVEWTKRGITGAQEMGIILPNPIPVGGYGEIYGEKLYEKEGFIPDSSSKVIDVGAQYGDFSIICSKVYGAHEVNAFEPIYENFLAMVELKKLNDASNVMVHNVGLSDYKYTEEINYSSQMLSASYKGEKSQIFSFEKLDSYNLKCDLIKIDVEGFELKVLKGGFETILRNKPRIIMEVHSKKLKNKSLEVLTNIGYKLVGKERFAFLNGFTENIFLEPLN